MLLLQDILSLPECKDFRIVSGHNGINNPILRTGFLEWESGSDISMHFGEGEFVVTTLAAVKDNPALAEAHMRSLIRNRVAAILIKDLYYQDIPQTLKDYSDEKSVPVIFFSDAYIDDLLYIVKAELAKADAGESERILNEILKKGSDEQEQVRLIMQLDPYLRQHICFCSFVSTDDLSETLPAVLNRKLLMLNSNSRMILAETLPSQSRDFDFSFTWLRYGRGAFYILTSDTPVPLPAKFPVSLMKRFFPEEELYRVGISSRQAALSSIRRLLKEAMSTGISCVLDGRHMMCFERNGVDRLLYNFADSLDASVFCEDLYQRIEQTGAAGSTDDYMKTLKTYVLCAGDINKTAAALHQHGNTIRYRIGRIQEAWECESRFEFNAMAQVFIRLMEMRHLNSF